MIGEVTRANFIAGRLEVLATIQLDDGRRFTACEINEVGTDRELADEFVPADLPIANDLPEFVLGFGFFAAKQTSTDR